MIADRRLARSAALALVALVTVAGCSRRTEGGPDSAPVADVPDGAAADGGADASRDRMDVWLDSGSDIGGEASTSADAMGDVGPDVPCPEGQTACRTAAGVICVDIWSDLAHCGACNRACPAATLVCCGGECAYDCSSGMTMCCTADHTARQGCVDLRYEPTNCGACGRRCPPGMTCSGGMCR